MIEQDWLTQRLPFATEMAAAEAAVRASPWIFPRPDKQDLNLAVIPWAERPDAAAWPVNLNPTVYVLADVFSTMFGSWNYQNDARYTVPQWAIETYNSIAWGAPGYFDDAGGDHHFFGAVRGLDGKLKKAWTMVFGQKGWTGAQFNDPAAWETHATKDSGWANVPIYRCYFPDQGQHGSWCCWPFGVSDVVIGVDMPYNNHVSTFAVWNEVARTSEPPVEPPPSGDALAQINANVSWLKGAWQGVFK